MTKHGLVCMPTLVLLLLCSAISFADPLPSWVKGDNKARVVAFVESVSQPGEGYVAPAERIAVFDNDGTLWAEQPVYFQLMFALDRIREMADEHPEWAEEEPYRSAIKGDLKAVAAGGKDALIDVVMKSHAGMSTEAFARIVRDWVDTARHPTTGRPYTEMIYQPMLELLAYLRANQFKTYIVSGGGVEFMRVFSEEVYGIPPEQVIGSSIRTSWQPGTPPTIVREASLSFIDDKEGKPIAINLHIGRRPLLAFGNSDGDWQMLQWTMAGEGPRLAGLVSHTDADREWQYGRTSHIGRLDKALDQAERDNWLVVDMKADWKQVYPD